MKFEKSAGAVVFREVTLGSRGSNPQRGLDPIKSFEYLLLAYPRIEKPDEIIWGFPKGQVELGESDIETVKREIAEETGLSDFSIVEGFKEKEKYLFKREGNFINKTVVYFLAQNTGGRVKVSFEHLGFEWLNFEDALKKLSFKNSREILEKAEKFLNGQEISPQPRLI